jgi:hypothetical protein
MPGLKLSGYKQHFTNNSTYIYHPSLYQISQCSSNGLLVTIIKLKANLIVFLPPPPHPTHLMEGIISTKFSHFFKICYQAPVQDTILRGAPTQQVKTFAMWLLQI